jgi:hypothetical protein
MMDVVLHGVASEGQCVPIVRYRALPMWQGCCLEISPMRAHIPPMIGIHRTCKCGAVYDRSEHIAEAREISSFECAVCGETIENWNSAWVPRYRFIACPAGMPND